jgi:hypothetical protein
MQNLHLKNLQNLNYINIYIGYLIKEIQSTNNTKEIKKFHNKATEFLLKELNKIKIVNSRITRVKSDIIHYITSSKNNLNEITIEKLRELAQTVIELNKIKDITFNSYIAKTSYEIDDYFDTTDYEASFDNEDFTEYKNMYYITPISYTRLLPFGEKETRYLDISIKNNKVIDINVNW